MNFNWESYIQLAEELIKYQKNPSTIEACYRTAISRSYYGVFCIARNILLKRGIKIPRVNTHKFIRNEYQNSPKSEEKKIAKNLRRLWMERKDADYEDKINIDVQRARFALELAKNTLKLLEQII